MSSRTFTGTYLTGIYLNSYATENPATITASGLVEGVNIDAMRGKAGYAWTIANYGAITDTGTIGSGIYLPGGGSVTNGASNATAALIEGAQNGVLMNGLGTVTNYGTIQGTGTNSNGVLLTAGGSVTNGSSGSTGALIEGSPIGVQIEGAAGTVTNYGTITANSSGGFSGGVVLGSGGSVINGASGATAALISGYLGVEALGALASVVNFGTILSTGTLWAIFLEAGGAVTNGASGTTTALISGAHVGINIGTDSTLTNFGTIESAGEGAFGFGVTGGGGNLLKNFGTVMGAGENGFGIYVGGGGSLLNTGLISGYHVGAVAGFTAGNGGTVTNYGTIQSTQTATPTGVIGDGILLQSGGIVTNGSVVDTNALISAVDGTGVSIGGTAGGSGTIANFGTIETLVTTTTAGLVPAIYLGAGGTVTNYGLISGAQPPQLPPAGSQGVITTHHQNATIRNFGTISPTNLSDALHLDHGGTVVNGATNNTNALIEGSISGIIGGNNPSTHVAYGIGAAVTVTNFGTVETTGTGSAISFSSGGAVTNYGQITSIANGISASVNGGSVTNFGTIENSGTNSAIYLVGGSVTNAATGLISSAWTDIHIGSGIGTIANFGDIQDTSTAHSAIVMYGGGSVTNGSSGSTGALISSALRGVNTEDVAATVTNYGTIQITASGTSGAGVLLDGGGGVTNGGSGSYGALITSTRRGINAQNVAATVANYGTVQSLATTGTASQGVELGAGGSVTNGSPADTGALIYAAYGAAVSIGTSAGGVGTVTNFGLIQDTSSVNPAVYLGAGGSVTNGSSGSTGTLIEGASNGVEISGAAGTVVNEGTIGGGAAVDLTAGGSVTNGSNGSTGALIEGGFSGIEISGAAGTVVNYGGIDGLLFGVYLMAGGSVTNGSGGSTGALIEGGLIGVSVQDAAGTIANFGAIENAGFGSAIYLDAGGSVANGGSGSYGALISSIGRGVNATNVAATVVNYGTVQSLAAFGTAGQGVELGAGGSVANGSTADTGALIYAAYGAAVSIGTSAGGVGTVTNFGTIENMSTVNPAVYLGAGGSVTNFGVIVSDPFGVYVAGGVGAVTNFGTISGSVGVDFASAATGGTVTNAGAIIGTAGTAVNFGGGSETLVVDPGASFTGAFTDLAPGDTIDVASLPYAGGGTAMLNPMTDLLTVTEGGRTYTQQLAGSFTGDSFALSPDGSGGTDIRAVQEVLAGVVALTSATEGAALPATTTVATFTDSNPGDTAGDFTASINWGDGTTSVGTVSGSAGSFAVAGGHTYADEGSDTLSVAITDITNNLMIAPFGTVAVGEGDTLVTHPLTFSASANTLFSGAVASFTDPTYPDNVASDFTASINWGDGTTSAGTVSGGSGNPFTVSGSHTYATTGTDTVAVTLSDDPPGTATATADSTANVGPVVGQTFHLTTNPDTVAGGAGDDTIIATSNTLSAGDQINRGGTNTLVLQGAGTFNLRIPTTLTNVETITAQEGQPAYATGGQTFAAQNQIVTLRDGLNATVDVSPAASINPSNPRPPTITIVGANNADVINLASGNDVVTLGSAAETVNLGSGNDTIMVSSATIGGTIGNGTGQNTLKVTGGGTMAMGNNITDIATVLLSPAAGGYNFTANAISGLTVNDANTTTPDTLIAGGSNQTLTGSGAGKVTFVSSAAGGDIFKDPAALFNGDSVMGFGNNGNEIDLTDVNFAALQPLAYTQNSSTSGTLTASDGAHTAAITLFGQFMASEFHPASDGGTGTSISYQPPLLEAALATPLHH